MTELNGTIKTVTAVGSADLFSIDDTSGYAAETTGGACGSEVGAHNNTEHTEYSAEDYLMCSHGAILPTGAGFGAAFNHDGSLLAIAHLTSPYVTIYDTSDWSKVADPAILPTGTGYGAAFNHDGSLLAIAHTTSPYVTIYDTSDWSKVANPATLPTGTGYGAAFNHDGSLLAVGHSTSPYVTIYDTSDWSKVADPATPPIAAGYGAAFNHDGSVLVIAHDGTPYATIYNTTYWSRITQFSRLFGTFYSPIFDTGVVADNYYMYFEADVVVTGVGTTWDDAIPDPNIWSSIAITTTNWNEIFTTDGAPKVKTTIFYKVSIGDSWSEMPNAEILSGIVNARYFQVKIEIEDPALEISALVENFSLKVYTET